MTHSEFKWQPLNTAKICAERAERAKLGLVCVMD